jgi:hypothetical protein
LVVAGLFAGLLFFGRGLPGGKPLSFASPKESEQRKGDPDSPEFPQKRPSRTGGEELAPLVLG